MEAARQRGLPLNLSGWFDLNTAAVVGVADGEGEGVAGVGLGDFGEAEHGFDHVADLILSSTAETGDGLFHFARGILVMGRSVLAAAAMMTPRTWPR